MKKTSKSPIAQSTRGDGLIVLGVSVTLVLGMMIGHDATLPAEESRTSPDCIRSRYGYSDSLSVSDYSRSRFIYTNATMLNVKQFRCAFQSSGTLADASLGGT